MAAALDAYSPRIASQIESSPTDTGAIAASHATGSGCPAGSSARICASSRPYPSVASPLPIIFTISESASVPCVRHLRTPAHATASPSATLPAASPLAAVLHPRLRAGGFRDGPLGAGG